jgi:AraC family transcriptional regulator
MVFDPRSSVWPEVPPGSLKSLSKTDWPGVSFSWSVENIANSTIWSINKEKHSVIVHLGGSIKKIETELNGESFLPERPIEGDIWIIPAGHAYQSEALGGIVRYAVLEFDEAVLSELIQTKVEIQPVAHRLGYSDTFLHRSTLQLAELTQRTDDLSSLTSASLGHTLMLHFFANYPGREKMVRDQLSHVQFSGSQKKRVKEFIADHLSRPILLAELAALTNMTSHELLLAFRQAFGTTPAQYVIDQRLRRTRSELIGSDKTIATVAAEMGFASHAHLTSTFASRYGVSPSRFRASHRQSIAAT